MNALRVYRQGLRVGYQDFRDFWSLKSWFGGWMLRILTTSFAWVLLGRVVGSESKVHYLLVGNAVAAGAAAALWASNATTWSRYDGTHPLLVVAPSGLLPAVAGRTSIWLFNGVATGTLSFAVLALAFRYRVSPWQWLLVPLFLAVVCASTYACALFMGALLSSRIRWRNMALDLAGMAILAFSGAAVPLSFWPIPLQRLAQVLPVTHGLAAIRHLLAAERAERVLVELGLEFLVGAGWLVVSVATLQRLFNGGRADGSIELV